MANAISLPPVFPPVSQVVEAISPTPAGSSSSSPPSPTTAGSSSSSPPSPTPGGSSSSSPPSPGFSYSSPYFSDSPPPPPESEQPSHSSSPMIIVGVTVGVVLVVLLLALVAYFYLKKKKNEKSSTLPSTSKDVGKENAGASPAQVTPPLNSPTKTPQKPLLSHSSGSLPSISSSSFSGSDAARHPLPVQPLSSTLSLSFEDLTVATNGFSQENLLGHGGFGYVYRGALPDGRVVAVKQLKAGSMQGEREFRAEVETISRIHHRHLVSLVGYCIHEDERLLVYEFVPNKTLDFHLHGKGQPTMGWSTRMKIAMGAAKGLAYLHDDCVPRIIHRDVKGPNILLDFNFDVKVADFGLAKLAPAADQTHVSTRVMGTFGYLAPEYASTGKLSEKSDVFSYGVMLLELISGRPPILLKQGRIEESLVELARPLLAEALASNDYSSLIDPRLEQNYNFDQMKRLVACAAASVRHIAQQRPKMGQVVRVLEGGVSLEELNSAAMPSRSVLFEAPANSQDES